MFHLPTLRSTIEHVLNQSDFFNGTLVNIDLWFHVWCLEMHRFSKTWRSIGRHRSSCTITQYSSVGIVYAPHFSNWRDHFRVRTGIWGSESANPAMPLPWYTSVSLSLSGLFRSDQACYSCTIAVDIVFPLTPWPIIVGLYPSLLYHSRFLELSQTPYL